MFEPEQSTLIVLSGGVKMLYCLFLVVFPQVTVDRKLKV